MTGKSSDVSRNRDSSKMKVVRPRSTRFRPCATTARLGSYATEVGAVGAVRRLSTKPGMSVISFFADPMKEAIFRKSSCLNSRVRSGEGVAFLLGFFTAGASLSFVLRYPLGYEYSNNL